MGSAGLTRIELKWDDRRSELERVTMEVAPPVHVESPEALAKLRPNGAALKVGGRVRVVAKGEFELG